MTERNAEETLALKQLLRGQLTAVNQQFIHILALRQWGLDDAAKRVAEVDNVDFPGAMRIIDAFFRDGGALELESEGFAPGADLPGTLAAEEAMENRMTALLEKAAAAGPSAAALSMPALAPRPAYAAWLAEETARTQASVGGADRFPELGGLFSHLMVMIEQSLAHAFLHRHRGSPAEADLAWAASGEAMMKATAFVKLCAAWGGLPASESPPPLTIAQDPEEARRNDRALAQRCEQAAREAEAACGEEKLSRLCGKSAAYAAALAAWSPGAAHPAEGGNPVFSNFARSCAKFVDPAR